VRGNWRIILLIVQLGNTQLLTIMILLLTLVLSAPPEFIQQIQPLVRLLSLHVRFVLRAMQGRLQVQVRQVQLDVQNALLAHMQLRTRLHALLALLEHIKAPLVNPLALEHTLVVLERKLSQVQHPLKVDVLIVVPALIKMLYLTRPRHAITAPLVLGVQVLVYKL